MVEHTRGPFVVVEREWQCFDIDAPNGEDRLEHTRWETLARVYGSEDEPVIGAKIGRANAHLFAAAQDLEEALHDLVKNLQENPELNLFSYGISLDHAKAALAKVKCN